MHTLEASACAWNTGAEMAQAYKDAGYTGIIVTDHFFYGNTAVDRSLSWGEWVERFCMGYEHAKKKGDEIGLQVFFGWESCYQGTEFLVYGLDKEWLLSHPRVRDATIAEQYALVHEGGGIISHAHPFREEDYIPQIRLFPEYVDAVEGYNGMHASPASSGHKNPLFNQRALTYAKEHSLPLTAGSDQHTIKMIGAGMAFSHQLADIHEFTECVLHRKAVALFDGTGGDGGLE